MEAMLSYLPITIGDKGQALADLVRCYEKMMMRSHTNGGYVNLLDECWKMCESSTRTSSSCTTTCRARTSAVCTVCSRIRRASAASTSSGSRTTSWIPRTVSRREMREAFSQYMVTVLNEKPLDPTLLDYEDALSW